VAGMFICMVLPSVVTFVAVGYPTWLPGAIQASDWLTFLMIFFSDTTWRMELKIVMNDHYKLLTKCCYFLDRLKIQDGHQRETYVNIATLWEICKTNFFSRTTEWIGTILSRNVPCKVLIKCSYFLFRPSFVQNGCCY
jgi:hypothetical protein